MATCGTVRAFNVLILLQIWSSLVAAQFGMGFGGMGFGGMGFGMDMNRFFGRNSMLGRAVREIVHPDARPSQAMIDIAVRNRGPPSSAAEMMEYTPHLTLLAFQHGVKPNGTTSPSLDAMNNYIIERGRNWMENRGLSSNTPSGSASLAVSSNQQNSASSGSVGSSYSTSNASTGSAVQPEVVVMSGNVASGGNAGQAQFASSVVQPATESPFGYAVSTSPNAFLSDYMIMDMAGLF